MKNVFVYGSLMFEEVWERIIKRRYTRHDAKLSGYKRLDVKGQLYPGLIKSNNSQVDGAVYLGIKSKDILALDRFEGKYYKRMPVRVTVDRVGDVRADVYVFQNKYRNLLTHSEWDAEKFRNENVYKFLSMYTGFNRT
jgi:gamma-glutamylcyclotransferase (GGCT)/AIG2-like uncharacterized protein YtfP